MGKVRSRLRLLIVLKPQARQFQPDAQIPRLRSVGRCQMAQSQPIIPLPTRPQPIGHGHQRRTVLAQKPVTPQKIWQTIPLPSIDGNVNGRFKISHRGTNLIHLPLVQQCTGRYHQIALWLGGHLLCHTHGH